MNKTYKVSLAVSKQIKTAKDLSDFYAYAERYGDDFAYEFAESEQERIDALMVDINYRQGEYDVENVNRIFKNTYASQKEKAIDEAIEYQHTIAQNSMSWGEYAYWCDHFARLGKRYGLLKEFRENGIC